MGRLQAGAACFLLALAADGAGRAGDWPAYGGDQGGMKYSAAAQITPRNVAELIPVWTYRTGHMAAPARAVQGSKFQTTPILAEDRLALCTPFNTAIALDPATGEELWRHDPGVDYDERPANAFNCRGVAFWRDVDAVPRRPCTKRIFMATNDSRLVALDHGTGKPCEGFGQGGIVEIDYGMPLGWPGEAQISSAPAIVGDVVVVGSALADNFRVEAPRGVVRGFDARTGEQLWAWDPIPRDDAARDLGWPADAPPQEGHANVWAPMSVDEARGLVFLPTSSPSPDFFGGLRAGDNRHANSVVALEAATGEIRWAFQTVHHDVWDYDVPAAPALAMLPIGGETRDAVVQVTKMGLIFVLDRDTGEPLIPVEERPAPQGGVAGEVLSPTQPFPVAPPPLVPSTIRPQDAWGLTPFDRGACRKAIAAARAEGLYTPPSLEGTIVYPFTGGGANWGGAAFDPDTNRLFAPTMNAMHLVTLVPKSRTDENYHPIHGGEQAPMRGAPYAMRRQMMLSPLGLPCNPPPWGELHAVDLGAGEIAWSAPLGTTEELAPLGLALKTGTPNAGGPLVTAGGLVFIGAAMDDYLRAFDAATGAELWQGRLPAGGQASPMTYEWRGRQYVVIAAGGHSEAGTRKGDYVVAFALPREGDKRPGFASRLLDKPGRRFALNLIVLFMAAGALVALGVALWRRRAARSFHNPADGSSPPREHG
ncbi:pyrroloquinoline quinone-dependent dehydrogenase [Amphiplicatus metriothermophilus]|uniref:Quinoprotein glucose dehydrogenase n=1 Tax=Amphiplicatus metriothermophilus TaxID=1519374 RepID=A0A239PKH7_9PROT|nr:pyrroloquinoline quinone-dependent dehydrogenase [Amphiplicatus metriothermophilus]MBB5517606.1 quinoprotein glucose dehydrogenase [Amphiplicatus metriothermophilus]SNT68060.1 quinoprotein glucose dehydrogenase [Amphiplicatus metriothermophilus]